MIRTKDYGATFWGPIRDYVRWPADASEIDYFGERQRGWEWMGATTEDAEWSAG